MLEKASDDVRDALAALGQRTGSNRKGMLASAARAAGITFRQAKSLFYGEPAHPALADKVRAAAEAKAREAADLKARKEARDEYRTLLARIERLETALRVSDEEFHRPSLDALGGMARGAHRAVDRGGE